MVDLQLLAQVNALRQQSPSDTLSALEKTIDAEIDPAKVFAIYGSLGPGGPNHHLVAGIVGTWMRDYKVTGTLVQEGWGAALGFPGLSWSPEGDSHDVQVLVSNELPNHWHWLDQLEGKGYNRVLVPLHKSGAPDIIANIYVLAL